MVFLLLIRPSVDEIFKKFKDIPKKTVLIPERNLLYSVLVINYELQV
jgi:hypothetical protein